MDSPMKINEIQSIRYEKFVKFKLYVNYDVIPLLTLKAKNHKL